MSCFWTIGTFSAPIRRVLGGPKTTAGLAYRLWIPNLPPVEASSSVNACIKLGWFNDAANGCHICVVLGTDGALVVYRGFYVVPPSGFIGTEIYRSVPCIFANGYQHLEFKHHPDPSTGTFEARVNGVTRVNFAGNTMATANPETSQIQLGGPVYLLTGMAYMDVRDMHTWDDQVGEGPVDFVGNVACMPRALDQDTAVADWAITGGATGYGVLSDNSDSTFISAPSVGEQSQFGAAGIDPSVTGIVYQQVNFRGDKDDAGDCDITPSFVQGSDQAVMPAAVMSGVKQWNWGITGNDPSTNAPWTPAGVNSSEVMFERTL